MKLRMHPLAAVLILKQMETLDARNAMINRQVRQINDRICQLPGLSEPVCRSDQQRVYYSTNMLFIDEAKAGMSRATLIKALQAEGVSASSGSYPENHKYTIYREPQWWHHAPDVPNVLAGCQEVNAGRSTWRCSARNPRNWSSSISEPSKKSGPTAPNWPGRKVRGVGSGALSENVGWVA